MTSDDDKPLTPQQARQNLQKGLFDYLAGNDPGPIVFRLKRTKKASETYPLKLTRQQRETLLRCTQLSRGLKNKIERTGEGTQIVGVTWNELNKLDDEIGPSGRVRTRRRQETPDGRTGKVGQVIRGGTRRGLWRGVPEDRQTTTHEV